MAEYLAILSEWARRRWSNWRSPISLPFDEIELIQPRGYFFGYPSSGEMKSTINESRYAHWPASQWNSYQFVPPTTMDSSFSCAACRARHNWRRWTWWPRYAALTTSVIIQQGVTKRMPRTKTLLPWTNGRNKSQWRLQTALFYNFFTGKQETIRRPCSVFTVYYNLAITIRQCVLQLAAFTKAINSSKSPGVFYYRVKKTGRRILLIRPIGSYLQIDFVVRVKGVI